MMSGISKPDAVGDQNSRVHQPRPTQPPGQQSPDRVRQPSHVHPEGQQIPVYLNQQSLYGNRYGNTQVFDQGSLNEEPREPEDAEFEYVFTRAIPGLVILIINSQFDVESNRDSALQDLDKMQSVFGDLGFEIRVMQNYTTSELNRALKDVATENIMQHIDCLACVISSHGGEEKVVDKKRKDDYLPDSISVYEHIIATKNGQFQTREILEIFDDNNCQPLRGKPKLFFIQACRARRDLENPERGKQKAFDKGVLVDVTDPIVPGVRPPQHDPSLIQGQQGNRIVHTTQIDSRGTMPPKFVDDRGIEYYEHMAPMLQNMKTVIAPPVCLNNFLVMFATMSETYGWSDDRGGWLLNNLYNVLKARIRKNQKFSLMAALIEVSRSVATFCWSNTEDVSQMFMKSMPCMEYKLTKEIFFRPMPIHA